MQYAPDLIKIQSNPTLHLFLTQANRTFITDKQVEQLLQENYQLYIKHSNPEIFYTLAHMCAINEAKYAFKRLLSFVEPDELFLVSVSQGYLDGIKWLSTQISDVAFQKMVEVHFNRAAESGQKHILEWMAKKYPTNLVRMISENNYDVFIGAALNGHQDILSWLISKRPIEVNEMIEVLGYAPILGALAYQHHQAAEYLLNLDHPGQFAHVEVLDAEYGEEYIYPYVDAKIFELKQRIQVYEQLDPQGVFNLEESESELWFYILRNLIRRYEPEGPSLEQDIALLTTVPAIKEMLHQNVNDGGANELLRLARRKNHTYASGLLLSFPRVRELAQAANYYEDEQQAYGMNLREISLDSESSVHALNSVEKKMFKRIQARYHDELISRGGANKVFEQLRQTLKKRYQENPATFTFHQNTYRGRLINLSQQVYQYALKLLGYISSQFLRTPSSETPAESNSESERNIILPLEWDMFQALLLQHAHDETFKKQALNAYYQHPVHTVHRYLSKPNPWMAERASYVYLNEDGTERWSTFEEYIPTIAYFYLAAQDKKYDGYEGISTHDRLGLFCRQIALIGRAHNWDGMNSHELEYDDGEGDKPSCYSGVKRRLFQSVLHHPLFQSLTMDKLKAQIRELAREQIQNQLEVLSHHQICQLKISLDQVFESPNAPVPENLMQIKIDADLIVKVLNQKYTQDFSENPNLKEYIYLRLALYTNETHLTKYYLEYGIEQLVDNMKEKRAKNDISSSHSLSINNHCMSEGMRLFDKKKQIPEAYLDKNRESYFLSRTG